MPISGAYIRQGKGYSFALNKKIVSRRILLKLHPSPFSSLASWHRDCSYNQLTPWEAGKPMRNDILYICYISLEEVEMEMAQKRCQRQHTQDFIRSGSEQSQNSTSHAQQMVWEHEDSTVPSSYFCLNTYILPLISLIFVVSKLLSTVNGYTSKAE